MKFCKTCQTEKDESEFNKDPSSSDGLYYQCRPCRSEAQREYRGTPRKGPIVLTQQAAVWATRSLG